MFLMFLHISPFFPFPNDFNRLQAWFAYCKRFKPGVNCANSKICSSHFMDSDFVWIEKDGFKCINLGLPVYPLLTYPLYRL